MIALILGLISLAFAGDNSVYVAPFFATDSAADETAEKIPNILLDYMSTEPKLDGLSVAEMKPVHDMSAELYVTSCPPAEFVGCAFVLAESSEVPFAVVGQVTALEAGARIDVTIIEIAIPAIPK